MFTNVLPFVHKEIDTMGNSLKEQEGKAKAEKYEIGLKR